MTNFLRHPTPQNKMARIMVKYVEHTKTLQDYINFGIYFFNQEKENQNVQKTVCNLHTLQ